MFVPDTENLGLGIVGPCVRSSCVVLVEYHPFMSFQLREEKKASGDKGPI